MSPPLLAVDELGTGNGSLVASPASVNSVSQNGLGLKERNYLGLTDCSSVDSSVVSGLPEARKSNLNLKATELRLGLPGSQSPRRDSSNLDEQHLFSLLPSRDGIYLTSQNVSGNKRGFSDTMDRFPDMKSSVYTKENWMFCDAGSEPDAQSVGQKNFIKPGINGMLSSRSSVAQPNIFKEGSQQGVKERAVASGGANHNQMNTSNGGGTAPAAKAQVVGWPPIRSFRKKSMATPSKNNEEVDGKPCPSALFIKVSLDGAPYLRKIDLRAYATYQELSSGLEKMFSCFTIGQCGSNGAPGREMLSESKLRDLLHGSEYVLTYEDKDGDWMLVGDVPWEMFTETCKKLKIMKSSDAIGLAPKGMEKTKIRS